MPLDLTPPLKGVNFDLLGKNALPQPHFLKRISWLTHSSSQQYYFLTLPNEKGEVLGIDQLFGDNTTGPDKKFAKNGYLALAKWDENKDSKINSQDPIFGQLRLWRDHNRNGIAETNELFSLSELGIEEIDLNYDPNYSEKDKYGNKVALKSAVKTKDQRILLIFDLIFRL